MRSSRLNLGALPRSWYLAPGATLMACAPAAARRPPGGRRRRGRTGTGRAPGPAGWWRALRASRRGVWPASPWGREGAGGGGGPTSPDWWCAMVHMSRVVFCLTEARGRGVHCAAGPCGRGARLCGRQERSRRRHHRAAVQHHNVCRLLDRAVLVRVLSELCEREVCGARQSTVSTSRSRQPLARSVSDETVTEVLMMAVCEWRTWHGAMMARHSVDDHRGRACRTAAAAARLRGSAALTHRGGRHLATHTGAAMVDLDHPSPVFGLCHGKSKSRSRRASSAHDEEGEANVAAAAGPQLAMSMLTSASSRTCPHPPTHARGARQHAAAARTAASSLAPRVRITRASSTSGRPASERTHASSDPADMTESKVAFTNAARQRLVGVLADAGTNNVVILCHGCVHGALHARAPPSPHGHESR